MKRALVVAMLMSLLVACGGNKVDDSAAESYVTHAEEVVDLLNEGNYEEIYNRFDETMKRELPVRDMEDLTPVIEESGRFEAIDKTSVEEKDGMYVTVLVAEYSNANRVFTITFNDDNEIAGLFIK